MGSAADPMASCARGCAASSAASWPTCCGIITRAPPVPEATAAETPGPEEEAAAHEELAFLQAALEQLPPEDRHLLSPEMQALSLA